MPFSRGGVQIVNDTGSAGAAGDCARALPPIAVTPSAATISDGSSRPVVCDERVGLRMSLLTLDRTRDVLRPASLG